jgi:hypothetical protein
VTTRVARVVRVLTPWYARGGGSARSAGSGAGG